MDTIFAPSTAPGKAGVAVIRISGPQAHAAAALLASPLPEPRRTALRTLTTPDGQVLDQALVLVFEPGHSFTGEATVEFQCHGSTAIVAVVLTTLGQLDGLRPAEPGEFTRRALENETLDLAQVEGLADLIDAETEEQRRQALRVFSGELSERTEEWRSKLIRAAALLEATIDFADEEVPEDVTQEVQDLLAGVRTEIEAEISGVQAAERVREGFEVAIVGEPNIGKSTLLNTLAGREAAITSETAGTTRDVIEVRMDMQGLPVTLLDTAGLRDTFDPVEAIGVERAKERASRADLRVFLIEPGNATPLTPEVDDIVLIGKADLYGYPKSSVSGVSGFGIPQMVDEIGSVLKGRASKAGIATRQRHETALKNGLSFLRNADDVLSQSIDAPDLVAEEIRSAVRALDSLVGRVDIETILDEIFSSFCLGK